MDQIADLAETLAACRGRPAFRAAFGLVGRLCAEDVKAVCTAFTGRTEASRDAALQRIWEHRTIHGPVVGRDQQEDESMSKKANTAGGSRKARSLTATAKPKVAGASKATKAKPPEAASEPVLPSPAPVQAAEPAARHRFEAASVAPLIAHLRTLGVEVQAVL